MTCHHFIGVAVRVSEVSEVVLALLALLVVVVVAAHLFFYCRAFICFNRRRVKRG